MHLFKIFQREKSISGLLGIERVMFVYCGLTFALALLLHFVKDANLEALPPRVLIVAGTLLLWFVYRLWPYRATYVLRVFYQVALLSYWYPDIYHFARYMPNVDPFFATIDQHLFGFQPALVFSKVLSGTFWSELFYMGYFSYYLMIIFTVLFALFARFRQFERTATIMVTAFMCYYVVFLFVQAAGPQFYFQHIGLDVAAAGSFPNVGDWFRTHSELIHSGEASGIFYTLVELLQKSEYPIAAFPSSHVGLATVLLLLMFRLSRRVALCYVPFYVVLCLSTVYIGAHYAIDVIGGWFTAIVFYSLSARLYDTWLQRKLS